jgi:hypothetical protein
MEGRCSCPKAGACTSPGKHPLTPHGLNDGSSDAGQVRQWWAEWPQANIGVVCGDNLVVLDIDPRNGGDGSLAALRTAHGDAWLATTTSATGSGGWHFLYRPPAGLKVNTGKHNLGPGIDVLAGNKGFIAPPSKNVNGEYRWLTESGTPAPLPEWLVEELTPVAAPSVDIPSAQAKIPAGQRNTWLTSRAGTMRRGGFSPGAIDAALQVENAGVCEPPLDAAEVSAIARSVGHYAPTASPPPILTLPRYDVRAHLDHQVSTQWIWEPFLVAGEVTALSGTPGSGKTMVAAAATAKLVADGKRVLYLDEENGPAGFIPRLTRFGITADQTDLLWYVNGSGIHEQGAVALHTVVQAFHPDLVILDSWINFLVNSGRDENSSRDVMAWLQTMAMPLARTYGAAVLVLDHDAKTGGASRGSGAKPGGLDNLWQVSTRLSEPFRAGATIELKRIKHRTGALPPRLLCRFDPAGGLDTLRATLLTPEPATGAEATPLARIDPPRTTPAEDIVRLLANEAAGLTTAELVDLAPRSKTTINDSLRALIARGDVVSSGGKPPRYRLPRREAEATS